jgi:hypothetical protein
MEGAGRGLRHLGPRPSDTGVLKLRKKVVMKTLKMDRLLTEMCEFYEEMWRKDNPDFADQLDKSGFATAFLGTYIHFGRADLVEDENGQLIWKATEKLVREVGPELGKLQPSPAPDFEPRDLGYYGIH